MEDNFPMAGGRVGDGSGSNVRDEERWGVTDEALFTGLPLTSCCVAWGLGTPAIDDYVD